MKNSKWKRWASLLSVVVLTIGLLAGCSNAGVNENQGTQSAGSPYELEVVRLVNEVRKEYGLTELTTNSSLSAAADCRAEEIKTLFSHTRPDNTSCSTVLSEFGMSYSMMGENIAEGQSTPEEVVDCWLNSPGHRANILNPNFKYIGVGHTSGGGMYRNYWVQLFVG